MLIAQTDPCGDTMELFPGWQYLQFWNYKSTLTEQW